MKWATGVLLGAVFAIGACQLFLPERFAVNVPVAHMLFGMGADGPVESDFDSEAADGARIRAAEGFSISIFAGIPETDKHIISISVFEVECQRCTLFFFLAAAQMTAIYVVFVLAAALQYLGPSGAPGGL